jgi:hypothetical protein
VVRLPIANEHSCQSIRAARPVGSRDGRTGGGGPRAPPVGTRTDPEKDCPAQIVSTAVMPFLSCLGRAIRGPPVEDLATHVPITGPGFRGPRPEVGVRRCKKINTVLENGRYAREEPGFGVWECGSDSNPFVS